MKKKKSGYKSMPYRWKPTEVLSVYTGDVYSSDTADIFKLKKNSLKIKDIINEHDSEPCWN